MAKAAAKKVEKPQDEFEFTVDDLAKELDILPTSARVSLRNNGIEKAGRTYGWNSKKEFDEVVAALRSGAAKAEPKAKKASKKK